MDAFKNKCGRHISANALPAQTFFESFEEMLANGTLKAVTLAHVVSAKEQEEQDDSRPEPSRQMGMHLDSALTLQTHRRHMSSMPTTMEGLRQKYRIMSNCWLLAQMRQPARHLFSDLTVLTCPTFCDELLSDKNFLLDKEIGGNKVIRAEWSLRMGYELELRKEAIWLTKGAADVDSASDVDGLSRKAASPRELVTFLTLETKRGDDSKDAQITALEKRLKQMENKVNQQRSRSPRKAGRGRGRQNLALPAPTPVLALPAPPTAGQSKGRGRGRGGRGKGRGKQGDTPQGQSIATFSELLRVKSASRPGLFSAAR